MNTKPRHLVKIAVGYKLPRWLVDWLRDQPVPAAQIIEQAIKKTYNISPASKS